MSVVPSTKAPTTADPAPVEMVEANESAEVTEPELAPVVRPSPVRAAQSGARRSHKKTLVSPIPALLAASMSEIREYVGEVTRSAAGHATDVASPHLDPEPGHLQTEDDSEYVVEFLDANKPSG